MERIEIEIGPEVAAFDDVLRDAREAAEAQWPEAMMLAWEDRERDLVSPDVPECTGGTPGWLAYALNRGGNLTVSVNGGAYRFIFLIDG